MHETKTVKYVTVYNVFDRKRFVQEYNATRVTTFCLYLNELKDILKHLKNKSYNDFWSPMASSILSLKKISIYNHRLKLEKLK